METRHSGKATTRDLFEKSIELAYGAIWLVIVICPSNPEKTGGLPWKERQRAGAL
jgi:hypothetical protein